MKTTDKKLSVSKSLEEVWSWKEAAFNETKDFTFEQLENNYKNAVETACKLLNARLVVQSDGSYKIQ